MKLHPHAPCAAVLCSATLATLAAMPDAGAQTIYKCVVDGKVAYADTPCPAGAVAQTMAPLPAAPPASADAGRELQRQRKEAAALEKARRQREDREERAQDQAAQAGAVQRKRCGKLKLDKQWADEDVRRAPMQTVEGARLRARRAADVLALECPR